MLDLAGHPHSEALTVTERFKRTDAAHVELQVTFDDPKAYNRSWTVPIDLDLMPDSELIEYHLRERARRAASRRNARRGAQGATRDPA